jgi:hypothetical protein
MTEVAFQWNSGGTDVKIAGSFNNWDPAPMIKSNDKWIFRTKLNSGNHIYKFIADGKWYFDPRLPTMIDSNNVQNNVMVIDNNNYKANSLISIKDNKLELKNITNTFQKYKDDNIKVVSILGSARMGKSTLLNTIISKYNNYNNNVFATSNTGDHCTTGIDFVYVPGLKIVFCDVKGLNHEDSSNDPKYLLITYLMSDIIIFTEPKMLNKNTLQTLSPLASFMTYLDAKQIDEKKNKPSLIFRISDFTLSCEPQENLEKLLFENNDQHKNLIINMKALFNDIKAFKTEQLDRSELKMLDVKNFIGLLESNDNGFNGFIAELNEYLGKIPSKIIFESWYKNLSEFIKQINTNDKIDFNKLDIYCQIAEKEVVLYINHLRKNNPELFVPMAVNHTQKDLVNIINKRIGLKTIFFEEFKNRFKMVNDNIKKKYFDEIIDEIEKLITMAQNSNFDQGMKIMTDYIKANFQRNDVNQLTLEALDLNLVGIEQFMKTNDINEFVVKEFNLWKNKLNETYKKKKNVVIELQKIEIGKYNTRMEERISKLENLIKTTVLLNKTKDKNQIDSFLLTSQDSFITDLITKNTEIVNSFLTGLIQFGMIVDINKTKNNFNQFEIIFEVKNNSVDKEYKYFKEIYNNAIANLTKIINSESVIKYFETKKKQFLCNKKYFNPQLGEGQFISDVYRINKGICNFYSDNISYVPVAQIKNKFLIKQSCNELVKNKLILKTSNGLVFNGLKYGSYLDLFVKTYKHSSADNILHVNGIINGQDDRNYSQVVLFNKIREQCIKRNNYKVLVGKKKKPTKESIKIDKIECAECKFLFMNVFEDTLHDHIRTKHRFKHSHLSLKSCFPTFVKN